jgi:hypothetical protein
LSLDANVLEIREAIQDCDKPKIISILSGKSLKEIRRLITFESEATFKSNAIRYACAERGYDIVFELIKYFTLQNRRFIISKQT